MKIIVCVKQVPASNETNLDPVTHTILRDGAKSVLNPFDAYAVEEAIRLRSRHGGQVHLLSMGVPAAERMLREALALGADDASLLTDRAFAGSDTLATAYALSLGVRAIGDFDLILCGKMASDGDTAQVGPMLAELLDIPHVSDVAEISSADRGALALRKMTDTGYRRLALPMPALLTVVKEINVPRLPSITGVLRGEGMTVRHLSAADVGADTARVGLNGSATRVVATERPDRTARAEVIDGTAEVQAAALLAALIGRGALPKSFADGKGGIPHA